MKTDLMPLRCIYSYRSLSKEYPAAELDKYFVRKYEILQGMWFIQVVKGNAQIDKAVFTLINI